MIKYIIKYLLLAVCGVLLFTAAHRAETIRRGYDAIGGEGLFVLLPVFWWFIETTAKDIMQSISNYKKRK